MGFQLRYKSSVSTHWSYNYGTCGGSFETQNGILTSPSHPSNYQRRPRDCIYNISVPTVTTVIVLNFLRMDIPNTTYEGYTGEIRSGPCYDYLEIRDGPTEDSPLLHSRLCGTEIPAPIISSQNQLLMKQVYS